VVTVLWVKVLHILAIISWMAGLLYLPRLMVYHAGAVLGSDQDQTFRIMERRLLKAIMRPAAVVAVLSGIALVGLSGFEWSENWLVLKGLSVAGLVLVHGILERHVAVFGRGKNRHSARYFRILNEVPTVFMVVVVVMVVVKPFS
jgi:protoporphyrinogen IX oxidase